MEKQEPTTAKHAKSNKSTLNSQQGDTGSVRTVLVAAKILDAFAEFRGPVRITDLARRLKMTMPRISRHVSTLRSLGYIEKAEPTESYRLGIKLFTLGQIALEQNSLANVAYPHLTNLRDTLDCTILLSTKAPEGATVLTCIPSKKAVTLTVRPGTIMEFPFSPAARIFHTFTPYTTTAMDDIASTNKVVSEDQEYLESRISFILANFYDFEADARGTGVGAVSAPVFDSEDKIVGALSIVVPSSSLEGGPNDMFIKAIKDAAMRISSSMGVRRLGATLK